MLDRCACSGLLSLSRQIYPMHALYPAIIHNSACLWYRSGKEYAAVLAANVVGPFLVTKHFLPLLKKKKTRVIVNSSSICGSISATVTGGIGGENPLASVLLPYNTSKAALNMRKQPHPFPLSTSSAATHAQYHLDLVFNISQAWYELTPSAGSSSAAHIHRQVLTNKKEKKRKNRELFCTCIPADHRPVCC